LPTLFAHATAALASPGRYGRFDIMTDATDVDGMERRTDTHSASAYTYRLRRIPRRHSYHLCRSASGMDVECFLPFIFTLACWRFSLVPLSPLRFLSWTRCFSEGHTMAGATTPTLYAPAAAAGKKTYTLFNSAAAPSFRSGGNARCGAFAILPASRQLLPRYSYYLCCISAQKSLAQRSGWWV